MNCQGSTKSALAHASSTIGRLQEHVPHTQSSQPFLLYFFITLTEGIFSRLGGEVVISTSRYTVASGLFFIITISSRFTYLWCFEFKPHEYFNHCTKWRRKKKKKYVNMSMSWVVGLHVQYITRSSGAHVALARHIYASAWNHGKGESERGAETALIILGFLDPCVALRN